MIKRLLAASVPSWLGASGLETGAHGFIAVNGALLEIVTEC
jgi:hypothetical protein